MTEGGERRGIISARREGGEICVRGTGYFSLKGGIREGKREESRRRGGEGDWVKILRNERRGWDREKFVALVLQFGGR